MNAEETKRLAELLTELQKRRNARIDFIIQVRPIPDAITKTGNQIEESYEIEEEEHGDKLLIREVLDELKFSQSEEGYLYLLEAIQMCYNYEKEGQRDVRLMDIYYDIADIHEVSPTRVIRTIRESIKNTWLEKLRRKEILKMPTSSEVIKQVANTVRLRLKYK